MDALVAKKSTRVSLPGNSVFGYRNPPVLHRVSCSNQMVENTPKHVLGSNEVDWMRLLRKNPPEFRYPEIMHSSAEMHPFSTLSCSNQMVKNTPKHVLGSNEVDWMRLLRKNPPEFRYPEIVHSGVEMHLFCNVFRAITKWSKAHQNMF